MSKRKVITIDYQPAMTFSEIAVQLNVSRTYVMEVYSTAMRKLMKQCGVRENETSKQNVK